MSGASVPRFISNYRWELWLLLGIPTVSTTVSLVVLQVLDVHSGYDNYYYFGETAVRSLVSAGLLAVCYGRVRGLGRRFLALIWGYELTSTIIWASLWGGATIFAPTFMDSSPFTSVKWSLGLSLIVSAVSLPVLLWFARSASRLSLAHAFFLFLILGSYELPDFYRSSDSITILIVYSWATIVAKLAVAIALAWLLGNFESRGATFRKRAVLALLAAQALLFWVQPVGPIASFWQEGTIAFFLALILASWLSILLAAIAVCFPLALIYLVRVRQPNVGFQPPPVAQER